MCIAVEAIALFVAAYEAYGELAMSLTFFRSNSIGCAIACTAYAYGIFNARRNYKPLICCCSQIATYFTLLTFGCVAIQLEFFLAIQFCCGRPVIAQLGEFLSRGYNSV